MNGASQYPPSYEQGTHNLNTAQRRKYKHNNREMLKYLWQEVKTINCFREAELYTELDHFRHFNLIRCQIGSKRGKNWAQRSVNRELPSQSEYRTSWLGELNVLKSDTKKTRVRSNCGLSRSPRVKTWHPWCSGKPKPTARRPWEKEE